MPADDFNLIKRGDEYILRVTDPHDASRAMGVVLDGPAMQKLARIGMALADVGPQEPLIPPYVVEAQLREYRWVVRVDERDHAIAIKQAVDRELARTVAFAQFQAYLMPYPERHHAVASLPVAAGVADALASLRIALFGHEAYPIGDTEERTYWYASGFTRDETYLLFAAFADDPFLDLTPDCRPGRLVEVIDDTLRDNLDHYDDHDRAALAKLRRWALGEDLADAAIDASNKS